MLKEAMFDHPGKDGRVTCGLCHHRCDLAAEKFGVCGVRQNRGGKLFTHVYGEVIAAHVDPIEKKPLYHFLPGTTAFSVATAGCNFRCPFCQNWQISQSTKKADRSFSGQTFTPEDIVRSAKRHGCRSISYTYTEPTIFFEYAYDIACLAKEQGLANSFVTNGFMTAEALETIQPYLDACNVDLKSFEEEFYRKMCGAQLQPVLDSIRLMKTLGIWVEVTTLVIPGQNDSAEELAQIAQFIAGVDPDIPWHVSRFHPDYRYDEAPPTSVATLHKAAEIGERQGLHYIYIGNVLGESENTRCPRCRRVLIKRFGFEVRDDELTDSSCPDCGTPIAGVFGKRSQ